MATTTNKPLEEEEDEGGGCSDMHLPLTFAKRQVLDKLDQSAAGAQSWRMKERMKTVSVALVLCLNVGVDPPDVVKTQPCARYECWIDPLSFTSQKALEMIGNALQKQYERWQPRARYKQSLDPTSEEVKKLCSSLRRNAKEERVLFHYNGHGVPKPTTNGEIWVFNRSYTQYIPLSIYDLQTWMGSPSIYVYDCSGAGIVVESFRQFAEQHEKEHEQLMLQSRGQMSALGPAPSFKHCIQLAACAANEVLPMNPLLPADLFTSCLTTPIKIALRWFVMQNNARLVPQVTLDMIDKIPGQLTDRRTILGELNWIFTAITDTIAWNTLPRELFQKLFRQDLLVASLFRNFLLAERIMRSYDCSPLSSPRLPSTHQHPMWQAWDLALDICLAQLPNILDHEDQFQHSPFFEEQLTAFQVWLSCTPNRRTPPEQLPIVLQVLLSQVHRLRALELLGRFLDLGPWAVSLALSVGIFPYVLKLLQSSARELRPLLVFIWAKIMAVDSSCQVDLVRDNGHKYFLAVLQDPSMPGEHRTLAAFVLASIVGNFTPGQEAALQGNLVSVCLEQLNDANALLRQWLALCLGRLWTNFPAARWCGVRDIAHEKLYSLLTDPVPEVRASAVWALGTFINSVTERSEHANNIDHTIAMTLVNQVTTDGSPLVRMELVVSLQWVLLIFETSFVAVAMHLQEEEERLENSYQLTVGPDSTLPRASRERRGPISPLTPSLEVPLPPMELLLAGSGSGVRRVASASSIANMAYGSLPSLPSLSFGSIYLKLWQGLLNLERDPNPDVARLAKSAAGYIRNKAKDDAKSSSSNASFSVGESPPPNGRRNTPTQMLQKKISRNTSPEEGEQAATPRSPIVTTTFLERSCQYFAQPVLKYLEESDSESPGFYEREWRYLRNSMLRRQSQVDQKRVVSSRVDDHIFSSRSHTIPCVVSFHPYEPHLAVADKDSFSIWTWENGHRVSHQYNTNPRGTRITAMDFVNAHDVSLLMMGTDDGAIRVWRNLVPGGGASSELVTAWQAMPELAGARASLSGAGLLLSWEQSSQLLLAAGDMRVVRVWDLERQMRLLDIPTGADKCVTCLSSGNSLVVTGCGDGSVRVFDRRLQASESRIMTWREHSSWVVDAHLHSDGRRVTSGCVSGDVRFFEVGRPNATRVCNTTDGMTAMSVHPHANIFACSSVGQFIGVYSDKGTLLNCVKYHDGFMGQRIGPARCLSFHPHRILLAAGSVDSYVSVYGLRR